MTTRLWVSPSMMASPQLAPGAMSRGATQQRMPRDSSAEQTASADNLSFEEWLMKASCNAGAGVAAGTPSAGPLGRRSQLVKRLQTACRRKGPELLDVDRPANLTAMPHVEGLHLLSNPGDVHFVGEYHSHDAAVG